MWESRAESGRQVGQLRAMERTSLSGNTCHHWLDSDAEGSIRSESHIPGSERMSRSFSFHTLLPASSASCEGKCFAANGLKLWVSEKHLETISRCCMNNAECAMKFRSCRYTRFVVVSPPSTPVGEALQ